MIVQEYQPRWAEEFCALRDVLAAHLGPLALSIDHVGSTSVPGMLAKPILDVDVEIPVDVSIDQITTSLTALGYRYEGEKGIADRHAYRCTSNQVPFTEPRQTWMRQHLYACPSGTAERRRHLHFRDSLVASPELREEYRAIKQRCAAGADGDATKYQSAKNAHVEFFNRVLAMESIAQRVNRAHDTLDANRRRHERGEIDDATWYQNVAAVITPAYLRGKDPKEQSGFSGDDARWVRARGIIAEAIDREGTFLDVGCASGYLMETMHGWCAAKGVRIEPYGLDIAPELAELARARLPQWSDRIFVGNAIEWRHPQGMKFDFVRTGLEYVPRSRQRNFTEHLLHSVVKPGGRLIVGTYNEARASLVEPPLQQRLAGMGYRIGGSVERPHSDCRIVYRGLWINNDGSSSTA